MHLPPLPHAPAGSSLRRWALASLVAAGLGGPASAETIAEVLQRAQQQRLAQRPLPGAEDADAVQRLRQSFERLRLQAPGLAEARLQVLGGGLFAEAVFGQPVVAASASVGELPEGERLLILAHELGHLALGHGLALSALYQRHIPGEVRPDTTGPVAGALGAEALALSWRHEYEADAFGYRLLRQLAFGLDSARGLLLRQGLQHDSPTHPGTRRRLLQIRLLDTELEHPASGPGERVEARAGGTD